MYVLGLMSGTSMDGIDCCLAKIKIDKFYNCAFDVIDSTTINYDNKEKKVIYDAVFNKTISYDYIDNYLGNLFKEKVCTFINNRKIDLISSHGQTIAHEDKKYSIQIGNPKYLNDEFKVPIIYNFRSKDILCGGNGAPLVPFLDWILFKNSKQTTISLNIGGISNISIIQPQAELSEVLGYDTGPGMCLIDRYVKMYWDKEFDNNGDLSSKGKIIPELLSYLMRNNSFLSISGPKSTTTEQYGANYLNLIIKKFNKINKYNFLRTLVNFSAICITKSIKTILKNNNYRFLVSGGGCKNKILISDINQNIDKTSMKELKLNGLDANNKESFLICMMGLTNYLNLINNAQSVTGANKEISCGNIYE